MACITTTEGRRDAARDVRMETVASTGVTAAARTDRSVLELVDLRFASTGIRRGDRRLDLSTAMPDGNEPPRVPDVVQGIGRQHQEVCPLSRLERSPICRSEHRGAPACRGDKDVHRLEAGLHHQLQLPVLVPAWYARRVCTRFLSEVDPHAGAV